MSDLKALFSEQHRLSRAKPVMDYAARRAALTRLIVMTETHEQEICDAISEDFGHRPAAESVLGDIIMVLAGLKHCRRHLKRWMKPRRVWSSLPYLPGRSRIEYQPLGVVGVMSPWNYPFQLALVPAAQALAAGNRVMLKPSELTPRTSALMARLIADNFDADHFTVCEGDAEVGKAFAALPFDHLVFTGSTQVGRLIARSAAPNLTPVTLELGGKSPAIFAKGGVSKTHIKRLAFGKFLNAGQTCIAPDYALIPIGDLPAFVETIKNAVAAFYPDGATDDYASIVSDQHFDRLNDLIDDARDKGAALIELVGDASGTLGNQRKIAPTLVLGPTDDMKIMQEEIFGPILPVMTYETLDEAIAYINDHDRPLALYYFGTVGAEKKKILSETTSGGVTVNDVVWHFAQESLPFGGVGPSGMGSYHSVHGFRRFSHEKAVFTQSRLSTLFLVFPPYGKLGHLVAGVVKKVI